MGSNVRYERDGAVAIITLDRPERRNAIDRATGDELLAAFERLDGDDGVDVGIVTGAGEDFCAGGDLDEIGESGTLEGREQGAMGFSHYEPTKPTIAAIEGHCVAGGLELAIFCDLRVAARDATFGCFERRFGVPLVDGGTQRLPRIVGLGRALDMILTGRAVDTPEASDWGLVNRVTDPGETVTEAKVMAQTIADFPQKTVRTDRRAVYEGLGVPLDRGLAIESWWGSHALDTGREGARRFSDEGA
jgi:enoyl-CoA hydratase